MKLSAVSRILGGPPTAPKPVVTIVTPIPAETYDKTPTFTIRSDMAGEVYLSDGYTTVTTTILADTDTDITLNFMIPDIYTDLVIKVVAQPPGEWYWTYGTVAHPTFRVRGYLLDDYPAAIGYALTRLKSDSTKTIRVRRDFDNAQMDAPYLGDNIDMAALLAWVTDNGTQPLASGHVVTWYNQQTNGVSGNATASDPANQDKIIDAGVATTYYFSPERPTEYGVKGIGTLAYNIDQLDLLNNKTYTRIYALYMDVFIDTGSVDVLLDFTSDSGTDRIKWKRKGGGGGDKRNIASFTNIPDGLNPRVAQMNSTQVGSKTNSGYIINNCLYYWNPSFGTTGLLENRVDANYIGSGRETRVYTPLIPYTTLPDHPPKSNTTATNSSYLKFGSNEGRYVQRALIIYNEDTYYADDASIHSQVATL